MLYMLNNSIMSYWYGITYFYIFCIYIVFSNLKNKINEKYVQLFYFFHNRLLSTKVIFLDFGRQISTCIFITKGLTSFCVLSFKSGLISPCFPTNFCMYFLCTKVQLDYPRVYFALMIW
jgi:hypothetical protein